jgi:hypothetical protein
MVEAIVVAVCGVWQEQLKLWQTPQGQEQLKQLMAANAQFLTNLENFNDKVRAKVSEIMGKP